MKKKIHQVQYCKQKAIKRVENSYDLEEQQNATVWTLKVTSCKIINTRKWKDWNIRPFISNVRFSICTQTYIQHDKHVRGITKDEYVGVVLQLLAACCKWCAVSFLYVAVHAANKCDLWSCNSFLPCHLFSWLTPQKFDDKTEKLQEFETPLNHLPLVKDCGSVQFWEIYFVLNSSHTTLTAFTIQLINHTHTHNCEFLL